MGISGNELASSAAAQAQKFGAKVLVASNVTKLNCERRPYELSVDCGQVIRARGSDCQRRTVQQAEH
jgi:thioredoxin reductase (NADPH)